MTDREFAVRIFCKTFNVDGTDQSDIYVAGVLDAVRSLPEREQFALEYHYHNGLTLDQTGQELGGLRTVQVASLIQKAIQRLRQEPRKQMMRISSMILSYTIQIQEKEWEIQKLTKTIEELHKDIKKLQAENRLPISTLNLSMRTNNALRRAGIRNCEELSSLTWTQLYRIRNIGDISRKEIIDKMSQYGYRKWADQIQSSKDVW